MGRRTKGKKIDGWLIIDKPAGITSTAVVAAVKRLFDAAKAGHGGTLDPLATGVLPIALGQATKTVPYVMDGKKAYRFSLQFGEARSTDDSEGEVIATSEHRPSDEEIKAALSHFIGTIDQVPPAFSAIKIDGERAYDLARAGQKVELKARKVWIEDFRLVERPSPDVAIFEVSCGKGAYMRSLARDLAEKLGSVGHIAALRRLSVGPFHESQAILLASLQGLGHSPAAFEHINPVETALDDIPALALIGTEAQRLRSGQPIALLGRQDGARVGQLPPGGIVRAMSAGKLVALTRFEAGELVPVRVMNI